MDEIATAVLADAQTEQVEASGETAVALAQVESETRQAEADAAVAIAETQADAAVAIAEAQSTEVDEQWLQSEFGRLHLAMSEMAASIATLASLLQPIQTPQPEIVIATEEPPTPAAEPESVAEAGPRESPAPSEPAAPPEPARRVRRLF